MAFGTVGVERARTDCARESRLQLSIFVFNPGRRLTGRFFVSPAAWRTTLPRGSRALSCSTTSGAECLDGGEPRRSEKGRGIPRPFFDSNPRAYLTWNEVVESVLPSEVTSSV